jgi:hypothetical protein
VLDDLDKHLESKEAKFARYADDFVILVGRQKAGERMMTPVTAYLERRLKLTVNPDLRQRVDENLRPFRTAQSLAGHRPVGSPAASTLLSAFALRWLRRDRLGHVETTTDPDWQSVEADR